MSSNPFNPGPDDLPGVLAIFPLASAVLLPGQTLPLNIFEPRYVAMVEDALGSGRYIGMIQPRRTASETGPVPVYPVGCAGRIISFQETDDGLLISPREALAMKLLDDIGEALKEKAITLEELLDSGEKIRQELYDEKYGRGESQGFSQIQSL